MGSSILEVGSRIHCEGEYGIVLYIGPIEGLDGVWLGVEWDNPSRGKHSGAYKDTIYFKTKIPNAGSFIRLSKADAGISCPTALHLKYGKSNDFKPPTFINLPQKTGQERHIEMVGMEKIMGKQSKFNQLTNVALSNMMVSSPGKNNELKDLIPNVINLDLSQNLLSSWTDVIEICEQLPNLSSLILSKNRLELPGNIDANHKCFSLLKLLVLNDVAYSWKEILSCAVLWPYIQELCAQDNKILQLETPSCPIFSDLRILNLDNNPIVSWKQICKLGGLKNLEELHIDNISLESIIFSDVSPLEKTDLFPNLKSLFIRDNKLQQWQDISELNKLARLKNLMVNHNPIVQSTSPETSRQLIIAKILGLERLNRTQIDRSERRGAEIDYLKRFRGEWLANGGNINSEQSQLSLAFLTQHPTYLALLKNHGAADENEVKMQSTLLKDNLTYVNIFSPLLPDKPPVTKKLPDEMTVGKLKALVKRIFKISSQDIVLTRIFKEDENQKTEMDNDLRQLSFYSLSNEDKICVEW